MTRPSYATLARRADAAMYSVHVTVDCCLCDAPVAVRVDGASEVTVTDGCLEKCHLLPSYPWERLQDDAVSLAQGERADYLRHLEDDEGER